jgi:hypothetical protein
MTTVPLVDTLIDKLDTFETVRNQIGAILVANVTNQMALATAGGKNPDLWKLRVYIERSAPWEVFLNDVSDSSPVINIWAETGNFEKGSSNTFQQQSIDPMTYNIDCYGFALSEADGSGHKPGDKEAALEAQRAYRLVRNILMSAHCKYLGMRDEDLKVWETWTRTITFFQPQIDQRPVQNVIGARLAFDVTFAEQSPQVSTANTLDYVAVDIKRQSDGRLLAEADFDYSP